MYIWIAIGIVILSFLLYRSSSEPIVPASKELLNIIPISEPSQNSHKVSIFSYNTLARIFERYQNVQPKYRDFRFRIDKIVRFT